MSLSFTVAVFFLGIEPALYSIVTYFAAAKMIDFVVNGIEEYTGVTIISIYQQDLYKGNIVTLPHQ
ncbi:MAG: YitT family protein [Flavobacterium sp.]